MYIDERESIVLRQAGHSSYVVDPDGFEGVAIECALEYDGAFEGAFLAESFAAAEVCALAILRSEADPLLSIRCTEVRVDDEVGVEPTGYGPYPVHTWEG